MGKVLFITHHALIGNGGGVFATKAFIHAFSKLYPGLTVLYPADRKKVDFSYGCEFIPITYNIPKWLKLGHLILGRVHRYFNCFEDMIKRGKYELVIFDNSRVSYKLIDIAHKYGLKVITIHHNFELEYNRDNNSGLIKYMMLFWTKKYEREAVLKSDVNLVLTEPDKKKLNERYCNDKGNVDVLGCFEYEEKTLTMMDEGKTGSDIVITGNLSARQTEASLNLWLKRYYPILKEEMGTHSVTIAGKNPSTIFMKRCNLLGINVIPSPISMDSIVRESFVYLCPISLGGGIKLRIMDGFRLGIPVIAHEISARGYEIFVEKGYMFVYHDPDSFRKALQNMKECSFNKLDIIHLYQDVFSFESGVGRLKSILYKYGIKI